MDGTQRKGTGDKPGQEERHLHHCKVCEKERVKAMQVSVSS